VGCGTPESNYIAINVIKVVHNKAVLTPIKEDLVGTDSTEIVGDIKPGDKIILHAIDEIKEGTAIK